MFTSRGEYRILLRQDNADQRLTALGYELGLASERRNQLLNRKLYYKSRISNFLKEFSVKPDDVNSILEQNSTSTINQQIKIIDLIKRPQIEIKNFFNLNQEFDRIFNEIECRKEEIIEAAEILIKYGGYVERERIVADKLSRLEDVIIDPDIKYDNIRSLSTEARNKLEKIRPRTIGQASRIPGVSPSDIQVLLIFMGR